MRFALTAIVASLLVLGRSGTAHALPPEPMAIVPTGADAEAPFTFTPVPYTVVALPSTPPTEYLVVDRGVGRLYAADEVFVAVRNRDESMFLEWAESVGFSSVRRSDLGDRVELLVKVPPESVDDALTFIARQPYVISARVSGFATSQ